MTILKQLSDYCDCIDKIEETDVEELINLISVYTCWTSKPCETFLMGSRKEVVTLPNCLDDCGVYTFEPFYHPYSVESFTFTLVEQNGTTETATPVTDYIYTIDDVFRLNLGLDKCGCKPNCGCESTFKLVVEYEAGYEELPDCLLPVFCEALKWIAEKNDCGCGCEPCEEDPITREPLVDGTTLGGQLQIYMLEMLTNQYKRQLSLISLCDRGHNTLWGFVV